MYMRWNYRVLFGYGVIKENGGGVGKIPWFLFCPFFKIFDKICASNLLCRWESSFLKNIQPKILRKSHVLQFFSKKIIFSNFHVYLQCIQISEGVLTLWRHSDVKWSSVVLILVSMDRGGPLVGVAGILYRKSREGVTTTPFLEDMLQKNTRGNEG